VHLRERIDALSRAELVGLVVAIVVTLAGAGLWYLRSLPRPVEVRATARPPERSSPAPFSVGPTASPTPPIVVDVSGLVRRPGVYRFPAGARVIDAVRRAGGARRGAQLSLINLAALLVDGSQIVVPPHGGTPAAGGVTSAAPGTAGGLVNINTASEPELETLNGVGPVTAAAIIRYRTQHGPFRSVDDLVNVSGIGPVTLEELRPFVTA